jgi:UDP-N-acetylmuramate dehydrogenase
MDLISNFDLSRLNTMGLASHARLGAVISAPEQLEELAGLAQSAGLPLRIIGGGSNLVLRDEVEAVVGIMATKGHTVERRAGAEYRRLWGRAG